MSTPLLTTKLYTPLLHPDIVPRPYLLHKLDQGLYQGRRLTLVSAPAGYGKTTLLSEWLNMLTTRDGVKAAWLSLDEADNTPVHFWRYLIAALQTASLAREAASAPPVLGQSMLQVLEETGPAPLQSLLTPLLNDLAALPDRIILILDDYHAISDPAIHEGMAFLLEHLPRQLHLVVATRADPPLPVSRLRGRGQLTELRSNNLRFNSAEIAAFLNEVMGLPLLLVRRLEGAP